MRLLGINLEGFRNIDSLTLSFETDRVFFLGSNGQGKSNLLEAIGLCSTLRSFRGAAPESMVLDGRAQSQLYAKFLNDEGSEQEAVITFAKKGGKKVEVDGELVKKLGSFLGQFPSVCLSSRDFRLVRESPSDRRKWMDLALSSTSNRYFSALQGYYRSMKERNALLKQQASDSQLQAFEQTLATCASLLHEERSAFFPSLSDPFEQAYLGLTEGQESAQLKYLPDCAAMVSDEWLKIYEKERGKDRLMGATRRGPHRDDFSLLLNDRDSRNFASEGQQKGVVLALRLAEFSFLRQNLGTMPILLADDVLGELDPKRRANFRKLLPPNAQTFATGTTYPSEREEGIWESFQVENGMFFSVPTARDG